MMLSLNLIVNFICNREYFKLLGRKISRIYMKEDKLRENEIGLGLAKVLCTFTGIYLKQCHSLKGASCPKVV